MVLWKRSTIPLSCMMAAVSRVLLT
jgi:hypothetical protein